MRGSIDSTDFCNSVEGIVRSWIQTRENTLRNHVMDNSNFQSETLFFNLKRIKLNQFIKLAITSWYMNEEVRFVLQSDLEEKLKDFSNEDKTLLEQFLFSKAEMLIFLLETSLWHSRDFFGNILSSLSELDVLLQPKRQSKKIKKPQRKRGYHDQGSRVLSHRWLPKSDYTLTALQNQIETERAKQRDTSDLIRGSLG